MAWRIDRLPAALQARATSIRLKRPNSARTPAPHAGLSVLVLEAAMDRALLVTRVDKGNLQLLQSSGELTIACQRGLSNDPLGCEQSLGSKGGRSPSSSGPPASQHVEDLRVHDVDGITRSVGDDLIEDVGKLDLVLLLRHVPDVWRANNIAHL